MEDNGLEARMMNPAKGLEKASGKGLVTRVREYMGLNLAAIGLAAVLGGCAAGNMGSSPRVIVLPGGTRITIPATAYSPKQACETRATSSSLDKEGEELLNNMKDYVCAALITKDASQESREFQILKRYIMNNFNIKTKNEEDQLEMDIRRFAPLNKYLIPKGLALTRDIGPPKKINIHKIFKQDKFEAYAFGEHLGTYERILLDEKVFLTHPDYNKGDIYLLDKTKKPVMFIPYISLRNDYGGGKALDELIERLSMHEVHHIKYSLSEEGADLFALSFKMDKRVKSPEEIINHLNTQELTYSKGMQFFLDQIFRSSSEERVMIQRGLTDLARKINQINSKYPREPVRILSNGRVEVMISNQQAEAMGRFMHDSQLERGRFRKLY